MNENIKKLVVDLANEKISKKEFLSIFNLSEKSISKYIEDKLEEIYTSKQFKYLEDYITISYCFVKNLNEDIVSLLCNILMEKCHFQHEDIVFLLEIIKSPTSIEYLYKTALTKFDYLDYDDSYALAVKCIWALGEINTIESKKMLEKLKESDNDVIKKEALNQLNMRNFKN